MQQVLLQLETEYDWRPLPLQQVALPVLLDHHGKNPLEPRTIIRGPKGSGRTLCLALAVISLLLSPRQGGQTKDHPRPTSSSMSSSSNNDPIEENTTSFSTPRKPRIEILVVTRRSDNSTQEEEECSPDKEFAQWLYHTLWTGDYASPATAACPCMGAAPVSHVMDPATGAAPIQGRDPEHEDQDSHTCSTKAEVDVEKLIMQVIAQFNPKEMKEMDEGDQDFDRVWCTTANDRVYIADAHKLLCAIMNGDVEGNRFDLVIYDDFHLYDQASILLRAKLVKTSRRSIIAIDDRTEKSWGGMDDILSDARIISAPAD
ncbi:unnamed protein product [Amoebophrya sp. A25]|nr:unnamed protein product [Amoebophrya sp. A25]|eukprot:GSA25T00023267001.1